MDKVISQPQHGRVAKVTKQSQATVRRPIRRVGDIDEVFGADDINGQQHEPQQVDFVTAEAAEVAPVSDVPQQQQQQQHALDLSTAANVLSGTNATTMEIDHDQHSDIVEELHHDDSVEQVMDGPTAEQLARQSGDDCRDFKVESTLARTLAQRPGIRIARQRPQQRRDAKPMNLKRRSNVEALLGQVAGEEVAAPCKHCRKSQGPWEGCVTVTGHLQGACANCWFNASGARCDFHETRRAAQMNNASALTQAAFNLPAVPTATMDGSNYVPAALTADPLVRYTIERAMGDVKTADKMGRQLMLIETTAKQLALQIAAYEDMMREAQTHQPEPQSQPDMQSQMPVIPEQTGP